MSLWYTMFLWRWEQHWHSACGWKICTTSCPYRNTGVWQQGLAVLAIRRDGSITVLCPPTCFDGTTHLNYPCCPTVGAHCNPVPSGQMQGFPHPPDHSLVTSGRKQRCHSCTQAAGCFRQLPQQGWANWACHSVLSRASFEAFVFFPKNNWNW